MQGGTEYVCAICRKSDQRPIVPQKTVTEILGGCDMLLVCTVRNFIAAAPLELIGSDVKIQAEKLGAFFGLKPDEYKLHIEKAGDFHPQASWLADYVQAAKDDLYVLSYPSDPTLKLFCLDVISADDLVSERVTRAFSRYAKSKSLVKTNIAGAEQVEATGA
jgi:hypothetical protein